MADAAKNEGVAAILQQLWQVQIGAEENCNGRL